MSETLSGVMADGADRATSGCRLTSCVPATTADEGATLAQEIKACLPLLPVLATQLREVAEQVEGGVVEVCRGFEGIAQRARDAVGRIDLGEGEDENDARGGKVSQFIVDTRQTMGGLLERIEQTGQLSATTAQRMEEIERRFQGLERTLAEIDAVASHAHLLALNGQIEAARAGKHGVTFAIVATETSKLAAHALEASKSIRRLMAELTKQIAAASRELCQRASADNEQAAQSRREVNRTLDCMAATHNQMRQTMLEARHNSQQLAVDISQAVIAMQFQDAVSQRVGHVVTTLEEIHSDLLARVDLTRGGQRVETQRQSAATDWTGRMAEYYTMAAERQALAAHDGAHRAQGLGENVELF